MEYVAGKDRFVAVDESLVVEIQVLCSQAKNKDDPAPIGNAHYDLKEHVHQREELGTWVSIVT